MFASAGRRVLGAIVDFILYVVLFLLLQYLFQLIITGNTPITGLMSLALPLDLSLIFYAIIQYVLQATPGQLILGMKTVRAADGGKASFLNILVRTVLVPVSILTLLLGILWVFIDSRKQSAHDKIAGTAVINKKVLAEDMVWSDPDQADNKKFTAVRYLMFLVILVLLVMTSIVYYLIGTDEELTDQARDMFFQEEVLVPVEENAYYYVLGFPIPEGSDVLEAALEFRDNENKRIKEYRETGNLIPEIENVIPEDPIFKELRYKEFMKMDSTGISFILGKKDSIEETYGRLGVFADRFDKLADLKDFQTTIHPSSIAEVSKGISLIRFQRYEGAWLYLNYLDGNRKESLDILGRRMKASRQLMKNTDILIGRLTYTVLFNIQLKILNAILDIDTNPSTELMVFMQNLEPLTKEEMSFKNALKFEAKLKFYPFEDKFIENDKSIVKLSVIYKKNATANLLADNYSRLIEISEMSGPDFLSHRSELKVEPPIGKYIRNFYGTHIAGEGYYYLDYAANGFTLNSYISILKAKAAILDSKISHDQVDNFLANNTTKFYNAFTEGPLEWNSEKDELFYIDPSTYKDDTLNNVKINF